MASSGSPGQGGSPTKTGLRRGPKPKGILRRKPGRPPKVAAKGAPAKPRKRPAATPAKGPARTQAGTPKLGPQGSARPGRQIEHLKRPKPSEVTAIPADALDWVWASMPPGCQQVRFAVALAHHLRLLPHLGYDAALSLPLAYLTGRIGDDGMRRTNLALATGWSNIRDDKALYQAVQRHVASTCVKRSRSLTSPTHRHALPRSMATGLLGTDNRPRGKAAADAVALADNAPRTHRRRANDRIDGLIALIDMMCDEVGSKAPMVSGRVLERFLTKAARFQATSSSKSRGLVARPQKGANGGIAPAWGSNEAANRRAMVDEFGPDGAGKRTRSVAELAQAMAGTAHRHRLCLVEAMTRVWDADRGRLRAFHVRLGLAGTLYDAARADIPFTPGDAAKLLAKLAEAGLRDLRAAAFGVADAHKSGNPHLHVVVVIRRGDWARFRRQLAEAYRSWGMTARTRGGQWDDRLVHVDEMHAATDRIWYYPVDKLEPDKATAQEMLDDPRKITPRTRLAAWRQAHGIRATFSSGIVNRMAARALAAAEDGAHPVLDAARKASDGGKDLPAALIEFDFAFLLRPAKPRKPRVVGSRPEMEDAAATIEIDLHTGHPALCAVDAVPGSPVDAAAFSGIAVDLPGHREPFAVERVDRPADGSRGTVTLCRGAATKKPTKRCIMIIAEAPDAIVHVAVEPLFRTVPLSSELGPDQLQAEFARMAANKGP